MYKLDKSRAVPNNLNIVLHNKYLVIVNIGEYYVDIYRLTLLGT